jgi:hypothetical protein
MPGFESACTNSLLSACDSPFLTAQYDDKTGEGKGCHPFTGWSALVVAMMASGQPS